MSGERDPEEYTRNISILLTESQYRLVQRLQAFSGADNLSTALYWAAERMMREYDLDRKGWEIIAERKRGYRLSGQPYYKLPLPE